MIRENQDSNCPRKSYKEIRENRNQFPESRKMVDPLLSTLKAGLLARLDQLQGTPWLEDEARDFFSLSIGAASRSGCRDYAERCI